MSETEPLNDAFNRRLAYHMAESCDGLAEQEALLLFARSARERINEVIRKSAGQPPDPDCLDALQLKLLTMNKAVFFPGGAEALAEELRAFRRGILGFSHRQIRAEGIDDTPMKVKEDSRKAEAAFEAMRTNLTPDSAENAIQKAATHGLLKQIGRELENTFPELAASAYVKAFNRLMDVKTDRETMIREGMELGGILRRVNAYEDAKEVLLVIEINLPDDRSSITVLGNIAAAFFEMNYKKESSDALRHAVNITDDIEDLMGIAQVFQERFHDQNACEEIYGKIIDLCRDEADLERIREWAISRKYNRLASLAIARMAMRFHWNSVQDLTGYVAELNLLGAEGIDEAFPILDRIIEILDDTLLIESGLNSDDTDFGAPDVNRGEAGEALGVFEIPERIKSTITAVEAYVRVDGGAFTHVDRVDMHTRSFSHAVRGGTYQFVVLYRTSNGKFITQAASLTVARSGPPQPPPTRRPASPADELNDPWFTAR